MNPYSEEITQVLFELYSEGRDKCAIKLALLEWNKSRESLTQCHGTKCNEKVIERTNQGNSLLVTSPSSIDKILEIYTEAIAYAANDSPQLAIAYGNRSVVLYHAGLYDDSLKDIDRALSLNYPDSLKAKLYVRKARSLSALVPEKRAVIEDSIAEAHRWKVNASNADKEFLEWSLNELSNESSFPEPLKKPDNSFITPDIVDANETLIDASSAIELKYSEEFGRHIVATRDINAGETLIKQKAYASVINRTDDINHRLLYCSNCLKRAFNSIPCKYCNCIVFCDEHCRDEAWENYHDIECSILSYILTPDTLDIVLMGLRLTIKSLKEAGSIELLREKLQKLDLVSDPLARGFTEGKLDGSNYDGIYTLTHSTFCNFNSKIYVPWITNTVLILFVWANAINEFGEKVDNMSELVYNESAMFIGEMIMRNMRICFTNTHVADIYDKTDICARRTLFSSLIGRINHSCDQNACLLYSNDIIVVNSIQMINKGDQIFINYAQEDVPLMTSAVQHQYLKDRFNFECKCDICREIVYLDHPLVTSYQDQILPSHVKQMLQIELTMFQTEFLNILSAEDSSANVVVTDLSYVSRLSDLLNILGRNVHQPCVEIRIVKLLLMRNYIHNSI